MHFCLMTYGNLMITYLSWLLKYANETHMLSGYYIVTFSGCYKKVKSKKRICAMHTSLMLIHSKYVHGLYLFHTFLFLFNIPLQFNCF